MARRSQRRSPFPVKDAVPATAAMGSTESILADDASPGIFGFFREIGTRETIESLIVAVLLALMFKTFEAEAFIIPTGSMAPSLNGQHIDLECENCGFQYHSGDRTEIGNDDQRVYSTQCPICQYETELSPARDADHVSNSGDRILVNKFIYDFVEPERFDVIVFKNPNNGKQNYIKRLIGLPGENILIENGDIFLMESQEDGTWNRTIARKPPRKLRHVLQTVADTHHIGWRLKAVDWPSRWNSFGESDGWEITENDSHPSFVSPESSESWLRYRHFQPTTEDWVRIEEGNLPPRFRGRLPSGSIIGDSYGYNGATNQYATIDRDGRVSNQYSDPARENPGLHWVGDIGLEAWVDVSSSSGELLLDVVEGGVHFTCAIEIATGKATLQSDDSQVDAEVTFQNTDGNPVATPRAQTGLTGPGSYHIEYVNADDQIHLWINNRYIEFDAPTYTRSKIPVPQFSQTDPGDAEPLGIGVDKASVTVTRLKVVRDIYYTSFQGPQERSLANEALLNPAEIETLLDIQQMPERWTEPEAIDFFTRKKNQKQPMFELLKGATSDQDQFLPMGDNSPSSLDGRVWAGPNYVERDMLIGRALLVYWPHTLNKPVRYFPNFGEMGFIR